VGTNYSFSNMYGNGYAAQDCLYKSSLRGQRMGSMPRNDGVFPYFSESLAITYRTDCFYCKRRIGFALKMPPADGQASATSGVGQCRLKLEVYFV
jgi:hypothetical protein